MAYKLTCLVAVLTLSAAPSPSRSNQRRRPFPIHHKLESRHSKARNPPVQVVPPTGQVTSDAEKEKARRSEC